jgi:hypothetical protein
MEQLETSLLRSRNAVLDLNIKRIEQGTYEQKDITNRLEGLLRQTGFRVGCQEGLPGAVFQACERGLLAEIKQRQNSIQEITRLLAALLSRQQRKLRVIASMLAGPTALYGPRHNFLMRSSR